MSYSDQAQKVIDQLGDRPVAYHPALARAIGDVKAALFLCQLIYWDGKGARSDGWIWKTQVEIQDETALTRSEQLTCRRKLCELGILEERLAGMPARMHFRVKLSLIAEMLQSSLQKPCKQDAKEPAIKFAETLQGSESTSETTDREDPTETEDTDTYVSVDADASKPPRSFDLEQLDLLRGKVNLTEKEQAQVLWPILAPYYLKQDLPEIPEVQKVARQAGGALRLGEIVAEHWGRPVIGDPLDFFRALAKERSPNGHARQSTPTADSWPPWVQFGYDPPEDDELVPAGCEEEVDDVPF